MNSKQECIAKAYGEYWELFPKILKDRIISNDGNLDYFILPREEIYSTEKICDIRSSKSIFECIKSDEGTPRYFRPKSLQCIEKNNGWVKIESEEDLPKDENKMYRIGMFLNDGRFFQDKNLCNLKTTLKALKCNYTHYQSVNLPEPPLH